MSFPDQSEFNLGDELAPPPVPKARGLTIASTAGKTLTPAQIEFNKRMKALERARAAHERERARLDAELRLCQTALMPLVESRNRIERDLIDEAVRARQSMKLTARRREWLGDLISAKAMDLLNDAAGLGEEDVDRLEALVEELGISFLDEKSMDHERAEFDEMRDFMEAMARQAGIKLDLSDIDIHGDPMEFERKIAERFAAAEESLPGSASGEGPSPKPKRKPRKATLERERLRQEMEDAKKRDIKSLYKQLAKVLHPDLETDPTLKAHKEAWMKRLTTANANRDLRDMLAIEMEWLGEEAGNLAAASDDKLRVYSMVLKEQLAELKDQTYTIRQEPQYQTLTRFTDPYGKLRDPQIIQNNITLEIGRIGEMVEVLRAGGPGARTMVHRWADNHARACKR